LEKRKLNERVERFLFFKELNIIYHYIIFLLYHQKKIWEKWDALGPLLYESEKRPKAI